MNTQDFLRISIIICIVSISLFYLKDTARGKESFCEGSEICPCTIDGQPVQSVIECEPDCNTLPRVCVVQTECSVLCGGAPTTCPPVDCNTIIPECGTSRACGVEICTGSPGHCESDCTACDDGCSAGCGDCNATCPGGLGTRECIDSDCYNYTEDCSISCIPSPTLNFTAVPPAISRPNSSRLTWATTNAASCTASGSGGWAGDRSANGFEDVFPTSTTNYTLQCWNSDRTLTVGPETRSVQVYECTGENPQNTSNDTFCFHDDWNLSGNTGKTSVDPGACTDPTKCEYQCIDPLAKAIHSCRSPENGKCGDAVNHAYCQKPTGDLCDRGYLKNPGPISDGNKWKWTCEGIYGSLVENYCEAARSCAYREVVPN